MNPFSNGEWITLVAAAAAVLGFLLLRRRGAPALTRDQLMELKAHGALVLDVRSPDEYRQGHVRGSRNIPLGTLGARLAELPRDRAILTVCASGARSGMARRQLLRAGFAQVHNAGPWQVLGD